jgi:hypothetical protein
MQPLAAHCHLALARLFRDTGDRDRAAVHFATATAAYRALAMDVWLERAEADRHGTRARRRLTRRG